MYSPSEDSYFFADFLKNYFSKLENKNIFYLDLGSGAGILAETAQKAGVKNILASDKDLESINYIKSKGINAIHSDLFSDIKTKFDIISFNAPYLPESEFDIKPDTAGGKHGDETAVEFLKQAKLHLNPGGKIFLLISSQTPKNKIKKFNPKILARKKLFFEILYILGFS